MNSKELFLKAQNIFRDSVNSKPYIDFMASAVENYGFYDGTYQWDDIDIKTTSERGQRPLTFNLCKLPIDSVSGVEIQSRYRTAVRSDSSVKKDEDLALALTHLLLKIQESEDINYKGSLKFRDLLICGIGWSHVGLKNDGISYEYVSPFSVIPDFSDYSPQFTNMNYVCRTVWMLNDEIERRWGKQKNIFSSSGSSFYSDVYFSNGINEKNPNVVQSNYLSSSGDGKNLVVEVQFKVPAKYYSAVDLDDRPFKTFKYEKAERMAKNASSIEKKDGTKIVRVVFCGDNLLHCSTLKDCVPNQNDFSYIPVVYKKTFDLGVPYGLMQSMKDVQRDFNVRVVKSLFSYNSKMIVFEGVGIDGVTKSEIAEEVKQSDSVIALPPGSNFKVSSNSSTGDDQIKLVRFYMDVMQSLTGVSDEMLGKQTNATSALAQNVRQVNSVRNNVFAFDNFSYMKKREGKMILDIIQHSSLKDMHVHIQGIDEEDRKVIVLNQMRRIDGEEVIANDVSTLPFSLYIEEIPDYKSMIEEDKSVLMSILTSGNPQLIMSSPEIMKKLGVRNYEKISKVFNDFSKQQSNQQIQAQQLQQKVNPTAPIQAMAR